MLRHADPEIHTDGVDVAFGAHVFHPRSCELNTLCTSWARRTHQPAARVRSSPCSCCLLSVHRSLAGGQKCQSACSSAPPLFGGWFESMRCCCLETSCMYSIVTCVLPPGRKHQRSIALATVGQCLMPQHPHTEHYFLVAGAHIKVIVAVVHATC